MAIDPEATTAPAPATPKLIVVAHNVRSLANVGTLFRTCDAAGVSELVLSGITGTPPDRRIDKVALDAVDMVPWRHAPELEDLDAVLEGRVVVVLEQNERAVLPGELELPAGRDVVLIACEELFGAPDDLLDRADIVLELPMRGSKLSLNVSVAASIAMYTIADLLWGTTREQQSSRQPHRAVRDGVLTRGVSVGETPDAPRAPRVGQRL